MGSTWPPVPSPASPTRPAARPQSGSAHAIRPTNLVIRTAGGDGTVNLPSLTLPLGSLDAPGVVLTGPCVMGNCTAVTVAALSGAAVTMRVVDHMTVRGSIQSSTLEFDGSTGDVKSLLVRGQVVGSTIRAEYAIGAVVAAALIDSRIVVSDSIGTIGTLTLTPPPGEASFVNSFIEVRNIGRVSLGSIDTDNGGAPFGLTARTVALLSGTDPAGNVLELSDLFDPAALPPLMEQSDFLPGDFAIHLTFVPPTGPFITWRLLSSFPEAGSAGPRARKDGV